MSSSIMSNTEPTLQGTLSHAPQQSLFHISTLTGIPIPSLPKLTVASSDSKLYDAILQYAALSTDSDSQPPLFVDSCRLPDFDHDTFFATQVNSIFNMGNRALLHRALRRLVRRRDTMRDGGTGLKSPVVPVPKFKFSLGNTHVLWPPPPHLTAAHLQKENNNTPTDTKPNSVANELKKITTPPEVSQTFYISHYSIGDPQSKISDRITLRKVLVVCPAGEQFLRKFAIEVIRWCMDKNALPTSPNMFCLYRYKTNRSTGMWECEGMKNSRPTSSVILPNGQMDAILTDVSKFLRPATRKWYIQHGLPHRRSYLFYGIPGAGKTSTIRSIASQYGLNCCYLSMTSDKFSNQVLADALSQIPANALIVIEDVDSFFNEDRKSKTAISLTFSGLLNSLDGLISAEGVITILTTNHIDRLDSALVRAGRVDRRFCFETPTQEQLEQVFRFFYPEASESIAHQFSSVIFSRPEGDEIRSIATLQQLFIDQREGTAEQCIEAIPSFFQTYFPDGAGRRKENFYS